MLRRLLQSVCELLLRIYFRKIQVVGEHHLPATGAVLFALNHQNALIDPLFVLCMSGRRVSFLAKEPLFRMPFVSMFVKAFECLPVYREADGGDPQKNRAMMRAAADLLNQGNALALFPEGTSHSDPTLKRFRSGAARIALSARTLGGQAVYVVPGAIYYEKKQTFRSRAVLAFGPAIPVPSTELDEAGNSPLEVGKELTEQIAAAVTAIMPTADTVEQLVLAEQAERVLSAALRDSREECPKASEVVTLALEISAQNPKRPTLAERMRMRRKLIDSYQLLIEKEPTRVAALVERIERLQDQLELAGLPIDAPLLPGGVFRTKQMGRWVTGLLLAPLGLLSFLLHFPAYQLIKFIAFRFSGKESDIIATVKVLSGLLLFPLSWLALGGVAAWTQSEPLWLLLSLLGPGLAYIGMEFQALLAAFFRALRTSRSARRAGLRWSEIRAERIEIAEEMGSLLATP